jgi:curved DNA-binding protein CbpA
VSSPFDVLCVTPDAPPEVIAAAYRALSKLHHPDARGSASRMTALNLAYEALSDEGRRRELARQRRSERTVPAAAEVRMTFGKHAGMRLGELPSDYLEWMVGNLTRQVGMREDARAVLAWRRGMP